MAKSKKAASEPAAPASPAAVKPKKPAKPAPKGKDPGCKMFLTKGRYLQQLGEREPRYIEASPSVPIEVTLPSTLTRVKRYTKKDVAQGKGKGLELQVGQVVEDENGEPVLETVPYPDDPPFMVRVRPEKLKPSHAQHRRERIRHSSDEKPAG